MISITCTNCKTELTIDDAFAGGVCRCQYCGTIQTVPARTRGGSPAAAPLTPLYQSQGQRTPVAGSGLDDLADAVVSSGLARSGLIQSGGTATASASEPATSRRKISPLVLIAGGVVVVLAGIIVAALLMFRGGSTAAAGGATAGSFCGVPVQGNSVVYLLDRGNSLHDLFDSLKATCFKSLTQLGPDRTFQVIMWDNDSGTAEFPTGEMKSASAGTIDQCRRYFQDLTASGSSHLAGVLKEALGRHPAVILVATGKIELDADDATALREAIGKGVRIDTIQIDSPTPSTVLKEVAQATGGQYRSISAGDLRDIVQGYQ